MYSLKEFKNIFDPILEEFLDKRITQFLQNTSDPFIKDFISYSKNLAMSGGKRVRPYIAYVMYNACGGIEKENVIKFLVSLEIFHTFALIHDDIMDKADKRHGVSTIHTFVFEKLNGEKRIKDLENVSKAQAILVGDLFFSWAMEFFLDNKNFPKENLKKAHEYFYKMVDEVVLGQMIDIDITTKQDSTQDLIDEKTRLKTSRYTFVRPMQIGSVLANPNNNFENFAEDLGTKMGIAFQMQDDLLDIIGDSKILEKTTLRDIADNQKTFFTNYLLENGTEEQKNVLQSLLGKEIENSNKEKLIKAFNDCGALDKGRELIKENLRQASEIINNSELGEEYKLVCLELIKIMEERQS